jgi:hypothetical protein
MLQQSLSPVSPPGDASVVATAELRAHVLRPTVYCPSFSVDECLRELRDVEAA